MKIYTKTGDDGKTTLFGGSRVLKSELRIESYGTVDELNAHIGMINDLIINPQTRQLLKEIQDNLFVVGAELATENPNKKLSIPSITESAVTDLELAMDEMDKDLPTLKHFILPGGHTTISHIHIARCVCRRAERHVVKLSQEDAVNTRIIRYLNRLSDYLFMLGRSVAQELNVPEVYWIPK